MTLISPSDIPGLAVGAVEDAIAPTLGVGATAPVWTNGWPGANFISYDYVENGIFDDEQIRKAA